MHQSILQHFREDLSDPCPPAVLPPARKIPDRPPHGSNATTKAGRPSAVISPTISATESQPSCKAEINNALGTGRRCGWLSNLLVAHSQPHVVGSSSSASPIGWETRPVRESSDAFGWRWREIGRHAALRGCACLILFGIAGECEVLRMRCWRLMAGAR